jgi:hypothetical protein
MCELRGKWNCLKYVPWWPTYLLSQLPFNETDIIADWLARKGSIVCEKATCKNQIKFITDYYLKIYKTLQLFTQISNTFTVAKVIKMPRLLLSLGFD